MNTTAPYREHLTGLGLDTNRIVSGLYQGAFPAPGHAVRDARFDVLVLCASEVQLSADRYPGVAVVHCPLWDGELKPAEWELAKRAANAVARAMLQQKRVLVTCAAGRNRSGLVTALALHLITGKSGAECVRHVVRCRTNAPALTNFSFVRALCALPSRPTL